MGKYLTKRNLYIGLFTILYLLVGFVSLLHSFAFFGLANDSAMSIMLGCCFEIGQVAVLMSLLTSKKDQGRVMPWVLMVICTIVQVMGNVFSSYKYIMQNSIADLVYFKQPVFVWTDLPDDVTTVIVTYIVGGILPIIALCMTSMVSNYIMDTDPDDNKQLTIEDEHENGHIEDEPTEEEDEPEESEGIEQEPQEQENNPAWNEEQEEVDREVEGKSNEDDEEAVDDTDAEEDKQDESRADEAQSQNLKEKKTLEEKSTPHFVNLK